MQLLGATSTAMDMILYSEMLGFTRCQGRWVVPLLLHCSFGTNHTHALTSERCFLSDGCLIRSISTAACTRNATHVLIILPCVRACAVGRNTCTTDDGCFAAPGPHSITVPEMRLYYSKQRGFLANSPLYNVVLAYRGWVIANFSLCS